MNGEIPLSNVYNQFQSDVSSIANNMMTQLVCAEKGIDYNQLMQSAHQAHLQGILQKEQERQLQAAIKRHYNGGTQGIVGKIKEVFSPEPTVNPLLNPFMPSATSASPFSQSPVSQNLIQQPSFPAPQQVASQLISSSPEHREIPLDPSNERVAKLEDEMGQIKQMIAQLGQAMSGDQSK